MIFLSFFNLALGAMAFPSSRLGQRLKAMKREFLPTDEERDAAYLGSARNLHDLEFRMQELDRARRQSRTPFHLS
ncbi:DUF3563 family protein [Microvirga sp. BT689]|uniref:DUF3563 family protein n=1 Tax=Microvirga arvi TaxID=2778731 RepID=UPI00194E5F0D|nr:DUF3563 family protein [Microvirga arvi]MBM6583958.1 DUF3563 family protein [Microvirga arvi]